MFPNPTNIVPDDLIDPQLMQANSCPSKPRPFVGGNQSRLGFIDQREFPSVPHAAGSLAEGGVSGTEVPTPFYNQCVSQPSGTLGTYRCAHGPPWSVPASLRRPVPPCDTEGDGMASSGIYPVSSLQQSDGFTASAFWPGSGFTGAHGIFPTGNAKPAPLNMFPSCMFDPCTVPDAMPGDQESFITNPDIPLSEHPDAGPSTQADPPEESLRDTVINEPFPKGSTIWSVTRLYLTINDRATICLGRDRRIVLTNTEEGLTATGFCVYNRRNSVTVERRISGSILDGSGKDHLTLSCFAKTKCSHVYTFEFGLQDEITLISQRSTKTWPKGPEGSEHDLTKIGVHIGRHKTNRHYWRPKPTQWYQMGKTGWVQRA